MGWDPADVPHPQDPTTYERSKLRWDELETGRHARLLEVYRRLAHLRRSRPELTDPSFTSVAATADEDSRLFTLRRGGLLIAVNFGETDGSVDATGELLFTTPTTAVLDNGRLWLPGHAGAVLHLDVVPV
jgi:maltooligosyltrehalose trehalohydrolase